MIQSLRRELITSVAQSKKEPFRFRLKPIELELELGVTGTQGGTGGIKFWVFELGGKAERSQQDRHKLKLTLELVDVDGQADVLVSQEDAVRSGAVLAGHADQQAEEDDSARSGVVPSHAKRAGPRSG